MSAWYAAFAAAGLTLAASPAHAGEADRAKAEIWAKEQAIYAGRGGGNFDAYIGSIATGYLAWPPSRPAPIGPEGLTRDGAALAGQAREKIAMTLTDFSLNGDTAVIYYSNHRTVRPDGTAVDETYENIHVWVRERGSWRLFGGMSRQKTGGGR
jgi:hypothetical protein